MEGYITFERKLNVLGGSLAVTIPQELVYFLEVKEGDSVLFYGERTKEGDSYLIIRKKS
jgi:antitoxin component of MazEF toxin-antitoxin module